MARRDFTVRDLVEIYLHWQSGQGIRKIASSLGVDRNTVRKYIRAAEEAGLCLPQQRSASEWAEFIGMTFPETVDPSARAVRFDELALFKEQIRESLASNRISTVWQRLRDEAGITVSLSNFRRYVRAALRTSLARAS